MIGVRFVDRSQGVGEESKHRSLDNMVAEAISAPILKAVDVFSLSPDIIGRGYNARLQWWVTYLVYRLI